jgi:hypothetical protein
LGNQPKDQFALAACVAGIDQAVDVLALDQPGEQLQAISAAVDGAQVEVRGDDRKVGE